MTKVWKGIAEIWGLAKDTAGGFGKKQNVFTKYGIW